VVNQVEVNAEAWPIVVIRIPRILDLPAIDSMCEGYDRVLERKAKFAAVVDTTAISRVPNAVERNRIAQYMKARTFAEAAYNLGNGVVIVSAPARAVLTALNWIRPTVTPQHLVATFQEALDWCCERLNGGGVALSAKVALLRAGAVVTRAR
jgi:hypothetical protein